MLNRKAYYFEKPLVTAAIQSKGWDKYLPFIYLKYIPELFQFYRTIGYSKAELFKTNEVIAYAGFIHFMRFPRFSRDAIQARWVFIKYSLFNLAMFSILLKHFIKMSKILFNKTLKRIQSVKLNWSAKS